MSHGVTEDPTTLIWQFSEVPEIEDVPNDAMIFVWDARGTVGLLSPWGDDLNPTRWSGNGYGGCVDGCWSESRGEPRFNPETMSYTIRENGVNLVQHRTVRKRVWWAWVKLGTPGNFHPHPTWRQVHGPLAERDWE